MTIERFCWVTEKKLQQASIPPIIGSVPAIGKIALGIIQATLGLLFTLISLPFAICSEKACTFSKRAFTHIIHGFGNVAMGTAEAVISILCIYAFVNCCTCGGFERGGCLDPSTDNKQLYKAMPYKILLDDEPGPILPAGIDHVGFAV